MHCRSLFIFGACLFGFAGLFPANADAGCLLSVDPSVRLVFGADETSSAAAPGERTRDDDEPTALLEFKFGQAPAHTGTHPPPAPVGGGTPAVASPVVELSAGAQLIQRLGPAGKVWLPPPFLSGVFRPPRFVV